MAEEKKTTKSTFVTLTNRSKGSEKPETINCGEITTEQKNKFFEAIIQYNPETMNGCNKSCGFNVYYCSLVSDVRPYSTTQTFVQQGNHRKNGENEIVIEMVPITTHECGSWANYHCPSCLKKGECKSKFVRQYVGMLLFPDRYINHR